MMRSLSSAALLLIAASAQAWAADDGFVTAGWNNPSRHIAVSYKTTDAGDIALTAYATDEAASPVKQLLIEAGSTKIATCLAAACDAVWKRGIMTSTINLLMVTATNAAGVKFGMPTRVPRPAFPPSQAPDQGKGYYLHVAWSCDIDASCATTCDKDGTNCRLDRGFFDNTSYATRTDCEARGKVMTAPEANQVSDNGLRPIRQTTCAPLQ